MDGPLSVFINIPASRLSEVKTGQRVKIKLLNSTISAVENSIDPDKRTGFATATLPTCDNCIVGDSVFANINVLDKKDAILITKNAVYYKNQKPQVVVVKSDEGKNVAEIREIILGEEQEGEVEVISGLKIGEEIVIANPKRIPPNASLSVSK
jgi:multidrug efflux pump subunit AcrA (membrane-fusion protein)